MAYPGENSDKDIIHSYREAGLGKADLERDALQNFGVEIVNAYPTDAGLVAVSQIFQRFSEAAWLVNGFPLIVAAIGMCQGCFVKEHRDDRRGLVKKVVFATGGWSGCERLIEAVLQNPKIKAQYYIPELSNGVVYTFFVPVKELEAATALRPE